MVESDQSIASETEVARITVDRVRNGRGRKKSELRKRLPLRPKRTGAEERFSAHFGIEGKGSDLGSGVTPPSRHIADRTAVAARERLGWQRRVHGAKICEVEVRFRAAKAGGAIAEAGRKSITIERQLETLRAHQRELVRSWMRQEHS